MPNLRLVLCMAMFPQFIFVSRLAGLPIKRKISHPATEAKARQIADDARKSASHIGIFAARSMLIGAFVASATWR
jgi:hypothetical protein